MDPTSVFLLRTKAWKIGSVSEILLSLKEVETYLTCAAGPKFEPIPN
jgi:hypothetical protein